MLKLTTQTNASSEVKMVEFEPTVIPARPPMRADLLLQQLTNRQTSLQNQLDDVTSQIKELSDAGVALPVVPTPAITPVNKLQ